jgi:hypothetical protein
VNVGARRAFVRTCTLALVAVLLPALASAPARAGDLQFSASIDQTTIGLGQQFQLVLTVQDEDMLSVPSPQLPPLPDFDVIGNSSSQSTSISIINGKIQKQATVNYVYAMSAKKLGKLVIPPAKLSYQGKEYESQPIEITVVRTAQGQATPMPPAPSVAPSRGQLPIEGNLFLSVVPSRTSVYVGEPITVDVLLCTRFQIANGGWATMPSFEGFWAEKIFEADKFDFQRRTIDGKSYAVSELKKVALLPLSPGKATIKPMEFNVAVAQAPRDVFDMFGGASTQGVKIVSKPITLDILPLPEKDKPAEFTGGVGQFSLAAALDRTSTTNNEPINLTVRLSGRGNLRMIDKPAVAPVTGLKILEPEIKDDAHVAGNTIQGSRTFRYPIIPQTDGNFVLAPIAVAYFDPQAKTYKTLRSERLEFSASGSATGAPLVEASGLKVLGTDIGYIKPDAAALTVTPMDPPWWPNLLYLFSFGMVGSAFWYRSHQERLLSDRGYARKSRSSSLVKRRLREAETLLKKNDAKGFHAALAQAVMGYVGDRFNVDAQAMTKDQLRSTLDRLAVPADTSAALLEIIDQCEIARFSPGMLGPGDPRQLFERARDVLGRI